ncbi:MAG: type II toxin-antitoxin system VapC family toxin [Candidatus Marinimicrobia bacterium]|nr:type II toxin-antitoxin system VapC family toxin [Candidatus Neomarinimicrobiota bacterium]
MRFFFDSNIVTYISYFEGFLTADEKGKDEEYIECEHFYEEVTQQKISKEDEKMIKSLRKLYLADEWSHFDWLLSDTAIEEILSIRCDKKRRNHYDFLDRIIEHRNIVLEEQSLSFSGKLNPIFSKFSKKDFNDCIQCSEAIEYESDCFITNDKRFIRKCERIDMNIFVTRIQDVPIFRDGTHYKTVPKYIT